MSGDRMITAVINDKFLVEKLSIADGNEWCPGSPQPVVHNGTRLTFTIRLRKADTHNLPSVQILYTDGPQKKINLEFSVNVVGDLDEPPFGRVGGTAVPGTAVTRGDQEIVSLSIPADVQASSSLYVMGVLRISERAFDDPELKYQASTVDPAFESLYREIGTPIDTNPAYNFDRFDFISSDYHHFYVHKQVLGISSDIFQQMFDSDKPEDSQFEYIKKGFIELKNLDGAALKEIFTFVYLGHTTWDFYKSAPRVIEGADMYGLRGLVFLCGKELIAQTKKSENISWLLECLDASHTHELPTVTQSCVERLMIAIKRRHVCTSWLLPMIERTAKHKHHELTKICEDKTVGQLLLFSSNKIPAERVLSFVSVASTYDLKNLMGACERWFSKNWDKLKEDGSLEALMEDETNAMLLARLALSLGRNEYIVS